MAGPAFCLPAPGFSDPEAGASLPFTHSGSHSLEGARLLSEQSAVRLFPWEALLLGLGLGNSHVGQAGRSFRQLEVNWPLPLPWGAGRAPGMPWHGVDEAHPTAEG